MTDPTPNPVAAWLATPAAAKIATDAIVGVYGASRNPRFGKTVAAALADAAADQSPGWLHTDAALAASRQAAGTVYGNGYERMFGMCALMDLRKHAPNTADVDA